MLAIIPARGGSKGIPRKNLRRIHGRPLIAYAIQAALRAHAIDRVIVSTEDAEIAAVARHWGADVPFMRPPELATDTAPNGAACMDAVDRLAQAEQAPREAFALIQATSPMMQPADVDAAVTMFEQRQPAAVVSLRGFETPIESVCELDGDGRLVSVLRDRYGASFTAGTRQSYGRRYTICGAVTVVRVASMRSDVNYYYANADALGYVLPEPRGLDIDTPDDLLLAELLMERHGMAAGSGKEEALDG